MQQRKNSKLAQRKINRQRMSKEHYLTKTQTVELSCMSLQTKNPSRYLRIATKYFVRHPIISRSVTESEEKRKRSTILDPIRKYLISKAFRPIRLLIDRVIKRAPHNKLHIS